MLQIKKLKKDDKKIFDTDKCSVNTQLRYFYYLWINIIFFRQFYDK